MVKGGEKGGEKIMRTEDEKMKENRAIRGDLGGISRGSRHGVQRCHVRIFPLNGLLCGRTVVDTLDNLGFDQRSCIQVRRKTQTR